MQPSGFYALSVGLLVATAPANDGEPNEAEGFLCPVSRAARSDDGLIEVAYSTIAGRFYALSVGLLVATSMAVHMPESLIRNSGHRVRDQQ